MNFGSALAILKAGGRVAREGWNGKGMFLFLVPGSRFKVDRKPLLGIYPEGAEIEYHAHIDMKTAQGNIVPWLASQTDVLADDWVDADPRPSAAPYGAAFDLASWRCHKIVRAGRIKRVLAEEVQRTPADPFGQRGGIFLEVETGAGGSCLIEWPAGRSLDRDLAIPGAYLVIYEDGYKSISPSKPFTDGYTRI